MEDVPAMANVLVEASEDGGRVDRGYREKNLDAGAQKNLT